DIVAKNRGPLLTEDPPVRGLSADELDAMRKEGALVLDTRPPETFGASHIPGSLNVDLNGGQFGTRAAWIIPPPIPVVLVLERPEDLDVAVLGLRSTGQDHRVGYLI